VEINVKKKILMGAEYTESVPLSVYGGVVVKVHAVPDMVRAEIEERVGFTLVQALEGLNSSQLDKAELEAVKNKTASPDVLNRLLAAMPPKMLRFLGEMTKAAILPDNPDPDCPKCKGDVHVTPLCECRDLVGMIDNLKGYSLLELGTAAISASTADWAKVERFFSAKKALSGQE
jgi:hypothetical protein